MVRFGSVSALFLLLLSACYTASPGAGARPEFAQSEEVIVAIDNQNFYEATIYAEYEGFNSRRLGQVRGFSRDTFTVAWRGSRLRMRTRLLSAGQTVSSELHVAPGDFVELIIPPDAHRRGPTQ
jgi:hypothetical protein